jgi:DNA repair exonuclease SbcCD ATPase subunit
MIVFQKLRWKNFLSTGNQFTEVDFQETTTTLVVGHNGAGKSTMLDALSFALFGRSHRNISKPQLINSINNKACVVEVEFTVSGSQFKIVRGMKPNVFEIWKNGEMINQESHSKEYQKILEQNIIKLNHKSFHQIVVLGSSSFIPFMQLTTGARREVIEDLLDIGVFSKMNVLLKEKTSMLKDEVKDVLHQIDIAKTKIEAQKKYIRDIEAINRDQKEEKQKLILDYQNEIQSLQDENSKRSGLIESKMEPATQDKAAAESKLSELNRYKAKFDTNIRQLIKEVNFFESHSECPTCTQKIDEQLKEKHILEGKERARDLKSALSQADVSIEVAEQNLSAASNIIEECRQLQSEIHANNQSIDQYQKAINRTREELDLLSGDKSDLASEQTVLQGMVSERDGMIEKRLTLTEQLNYNIVVSEMLKDTGIKTKIVKQYLPVINKLVNQYLQILDFFVSFNLDEAFQETIKSRFRDSFTYDSFSEGEKQRIDLALLFTWRMVAKMKNSVSTNLLILDETFDSSLDYEGVDNLMKIIYTLGDDTNVFVISHKGDILDGKFKRKLEFHKEKNFSKLKGT